MQESPRTTSRSEDMRQDHPDRDQNKPLYRARRTIAKSIVGAVIVFAGGMHSAIRSRCFLASRDFHDGLLARSRRR
jgi:hypothetical protein